MAAPSISRTLNPRSDPASPWWHIDITPVLAAVALGFIGLVGIYSATRGRDDENYIIDDARQQAIFLVIGLALAVAMLFFDYRILAKLSFILYAGTIAVLASVLVIGVRINGARSWFQAGSFQAQPSELAKITLIVTLATLLARTTTQTLALWRLALLIGIGLAPIGLIVLQPDIGTAMVMVVVVAALAMVGRAEAHHLIFLVVVGALGVGLLMNSPLLETYQRQRLEAFLDPTAEISYNQRQAQIAIGNGGVTGTGFGEGTQTKSGLVPEQQTDFIFTVIAEEFGFAGGAVLLACFGLLLWRLYRIAQLAGDPFGRYLVCGVLAMFSFQMFQSIGMTLGIMPVTGIPLPFVSYGGSSAFTSFIGIGLAISVHMRRFQAGVDAEVNQLREA